MSPTVITTKQNIMVISDGASNYKCYLMGSLFTYGLLVTQELHVSHIRGFSSHRGLFLS
jgi:hypothetical protein